MINVNQKRDISVITVDPQTRYFQTSAKTLNYLLVQDYCKDCNKMSRVTMSCYAASKHIPEKDGSVARLLPKEKPKSNKPNKYGEMETSVSLDKYSGKLMNSIWGLYNRNSPHNFKQQNAEAVAIKEHETTTAATAIFQFSAPQFEGIVSVVAKYDVKKPKTSLDKFENLLNSPIF